MTSDLLRCLGGVLIYVTVFVLTPGMGAGRRVVGGLLLSTVIFLAMRVWR